MRIDPEDHGSVEFDDPLVVVDPTDPERNVAAVCSAESVARLQHYARNLLTDPRVDLFEPDERDPLSAAAVREGFERRGTTPVALRFDAPDVVDDQLYPQLERSREGLVDELDRRGFDVLRSAAFADGTGVLLAELAVAERPAVERHDGPPVAVREHAERFYGTYADGETDGEEDTGRDEFVYGPYVDGDRYVVEREREFATAAEFLASDTVFDVALGVQVAEALETGYDVLVGDDVGALADEFGRDLAAYLDPRP